MYRSFLNSSLTSDKLKEINRNATENSKYCNGLCQDFRDKSSFSGQRVFCNPCRNHLNLAEKQIKDNTITLEQFKENPDIVYGIDLVIDTLRTCMTCKQEKTTNQYEKTRNECKACRSIKASERNNTGIDVLISDVNKLKNNLKELENFLLGTPKDKLIKIISHFTVGRKATDTKNDMVHNCVEHFKKILSPLLCQGGCGRTLQEDFSTCVPCLEKKNKPRAVKKMFDFDENLDDIVSNLDVITENFDKYNREQYYKIAAKLGLKIKQKTRKAAVIILINEELKKKKEEQTKKETELALAADGCKTEYALTFNGILIESRKEDGFVNATSMCKAGKKKFNDWYRLDNTKELVTSLEIDARASATQNLITGNPAIKIVDKKLGRYGCSWIHPDLAVQLAQWISPIFALQVSKWIRELAVTGTVTVGMEKTNKELLEVQNKLSEQILMTNEQIAINKKLEKKHNRILYKRQYHKFHKGPCFYIVSSGDDTKLGFDGVDVNERFRGYRTQDPKLKIHYIVFTEHAHILEQNMLLRFNCKKLEQNHEVIVKDIELTQLINDCETIMSVINIEKTIVSQEELNKYNE